MIKAIATTTTLMLLLGLLVLSSWLCLPTLLRAGESAAESTAVSLQIDLRIDPRLIAEAAEVWAVIAADRNPVWPGWNASDTPLLFYLPGEQDVLINHPRPPEGFVAYTGPVRFAGAKIAVRGGPTLLEWDGQNTSIDVEGVTTLAVADPLSNLKLQVGGLIEESRQQPAQPPKLEYAQLASDPYDQMALVVHEAYHVFQSRAAPDKGANEMLLLRYPVLSPDNNVGFAQEGAALAAALRAADKAAFREAVVRWIALRTDRRAKLPPPAVEYEDGVEFLEGLAEYTEYRLFEALEQRTPAPEMWWVQGFHGYGDLSACRARLLDEMLRHMRGEASVNNDPYGTAPLRMRLYYSGMAIAAVLDRLSPDWKSRILEPQTTLTALATEQAHASGAELSRALADARHGAEHDTLLAAKTRLAQAGRARIASELADIESGEGTGILVDYSALESPDVRLAFTPFGIRVVDDDRTIFEQAPVQVRFADGYQIAQHEPRPLLQDKKRRLIRFRLADSLPAGALEKAAGVTAFTGQDIGDLQIDLPAVTLSAAAASLRWEGRDLRIDLKPRRDHDLGSGKGTPR